MTAPTGPSVLPLRLVLATKGLLDAATRLWPNLDDVPEEIREQFWELHEIWVDEVEEAIRRGPATS